MSLKFLQAKKRASTDQKVTDMLKFFQTETNPEKRQQAANNLIVLARENSGAERLMARKAPEQFAKMLRDQKLEHNVKLAIIRTLGELLKGDAARVCFNLIRNCIDSDLWLFLP